MGDVKKLYGLLLTRNKYNPLPPHTNDETIANDFLHFLDNISTDLSHIECSTLNAPFLNATLTESKPFSENDVTKLI